MEHDQRVPVSNRIPPREAGGPPVRGSQPLSAKQMSQILKCNANNAGEHTVFDALLPVRRRSFTGASRRLVVDYHAESVSENPQTASRYLRLMELVSPDAEGFAMVEGISDNQYREFNEFPLSEQSRSWAAFGNNPML